MSPEPIIPLTCLRRPWWFFSRRQELQETKSQYRGNVERENERQQFSRLPYRVPALEPPRYQALRHLMEHYQEVKAFDR